MISGYGQGLNEFLKNFDIQGGSRDLKKLYSRYREEDKFIISAKALGFFYSDIFFVENIKKHYSIFEYHWVKWLILHILFQYSRGNLRTDLESLERDISFWFPQEDKPFDPKEFIKKVPGLIEGNPELFSLSNSPFKIIKNSIYINRIEKYEKKFLALLDERLRYKSNGLNADLSSYSGDRLEAIKKALKYNFLIISGGPGTGKTTTVISIIRALKEGGVKSILLGAPTGRAAKRVTESIHSGLGEGEELESEAYTLHKLLGYTPGKVKPRYHRERPLPADAVIIDEASMVDIHMMYRLFDALKPTTKLILVGDKNQLPSVEAGALLGDFLYRSNEEEHLMYNNVVMLKTFYRSNKRIIELATRVIDGDVKGTLELLGEGLNERAHYDLPDFDSFISDIKRNFREGCKPFRSPVSNYKNHLEDIDNYFTLFSSFTLLTPSRKGLWGTTSINKRMRHEYGGSYQPFYHGEPIMITRNDYINRLFNGDRGIVFKFSNGMYAFFKDATGYRVISVSKLVDYETSYAGTVHKSQGSEFDQVAIVIPEGSDKLLTREILYTALTRAKNRILLYGNEAEIIKSVEEKIVRSSGIREFLIPRE